MQTVQLRNYQQQGEAQIYLAWQNGALVVFYVLPTGGGKTVLFSKILHDHNGASCAIAHRQELVGQISLALARNAVAHRIIAPPAVVKFCVNQHMIELGKSYFNPSARAAVAGVDTLNSRRDDPGVIRWGRTVTKFVQDEGHHTLTANKWGNAAALFPNARGLLVSATPRRTDGKGLGRHADGLADALVIGPGMRELIDRGYLTDYRIFAPPNDLDLSDVNTTATGDFNSKKAAVAVRRSKVIGDVVKHYKKYAAGKLGVTFATDVETAGKIAAEFNAAGVPAEVVSAKTPAAERVAIVARFKRGELKQLVNCDLFGEGFDLPAIEVISMARPTQSFVVFCQQFGRALRIMPGKKFALIIDHVGNVVRHGLPDAPQAWTLDRRDKRSTTDGGGVPVKVCPACVAVYERVYKSCPYCGFEPIPAARSSIDFVDGDLTELDAETLARMRGDVARVDTDKEIIRAELAAKHAPVLGQMAGVKRHAETQQAQKVLREAVAWWAGHQRHAGRPDHESYRRFYFKFGVDVLTAMSMKAKPALELTDKINRQIYQGATI